MKIMYVLPSLKRDGPNNQMIYIINSVKAIGHQIIVVALEDNENADERFLKLGIHIEICPISLRDVFLRKTKHLYDMIKKYQPDVVQTYGIRPDCALSVNKCPVLVSTVRCSIKQCYHFDYGKLKGDLATAYHSKFLKDGRIIVACSDAVKAYNNEELGLETEYVVRNAISEDYSITTIDQRKKFRKEIGVGENEILISSTGYLTEAKDPITIAQAVSMYNKENHTKLKVAFLGDGPLKSKLNELNDGSFILPGHVSNVSEWLDSSDMYISGSHFEGMPNAVLEGMRSFLPVVLSDIPSHVEIVTNSSKYIGELFECSNAESLVKALSKLMRENIKLVGKNAYYAIHNDYSIERLGVQYDCIYRNIMKG